MPAAEIPVRLEKLHFLVEDLRLASALAQAAPDGWSSRLMARHILIRASDVIAHSRGLRRYVQPLGQIRAFNEAKETYATWFDEYFRAARDRLGAHVQDLDFGLRIDLWNDIETSKVNVFVEGAAQIYGALGGLGLPGYLPLLSAPAETGDPAFAASLADFRASTAPLRPEFAADPLGMTRPGTLSGMGNTPLHERAAQLSLISRWITWDQEVLGRFSAFPRVGRILRARLVTDLVSFADCLVTRAVAPGAPQTLIGFNDLVANEGRPSRAVTEFLGTYQFEQSVDRFRPLRNQFGGHLEIDSATPLPALFALVDGLDCSDVTSVFATLSAVFRATCGERIYLATYLADGEEIRGGVPQPSDAVKAYDPLAPAPILPQLARRHLATESELRSALNDWFSHDASRRAAAQDLFRSAYGATTGEEFRLEHAIGSGKRWDTHIFTLAHCIILEALTCADNEHRLSHLLELLLSARHNYTDRAAEVLVRFAASPDSRWQQLSFCSALGEVATWDVPRHIDLLRAMAGGKHPWELRRAAIIGLFRCFVRDEGLKRINGGSPLPDAARDIEPLIVPLPPERRLELRLAMASTFCAYGMDIFVQQFKNEIKAINDDLHALACGELERQSRQVDGVDVAKLIRISDFVGIVLLLSGRDPSSHMRELLDLVHSGMIVPARHEIAGKHLANCFWLMGDIERALEVATRLVERNPGSVSNELLRLAILTNRVGCREEVMAGVDRLRKQFKLSSEEEASLAEIEASPEPV